MLDVIRRDHPNADLRTRLVPRLPSYRKIIPPFGAFLAKHLVDEVTDVNHSSGFVEVVTSIVFQKSDVGSAGRGHCARRFIEFLGRNGKVRHLPGLYGLLSRRSNLCKDGQKETESARDAKAQTR